MLSKYSFTRVRSREPSERRRSPASAEIESRMLFSCLTRTARLAAVPACPNSRSNTVRGLISIGSGEVGELQAMVFRYAQLKPGEQAPTYPVKSSVATSSDGSGVSCPICFRSEEHTSELQSLRH